MREGSGCCLELTVCPLARKKLYFAILDFNGWGAPEGVVSAKRSQTNSMPNNRELKRVPRCLLPVNNLNLEPEYVGERLGWAYVRVPCKACGIQYDRREIEEYSHPYAHHVSCFLCPKGHLGEARRLWEPVKAAKKRICKGTKARSSRYLGIPEHTPRTILEVNVIG